jgi:DNA (cytosine-5)-methyltransferase 1
MKSSNPRSGIYEADTSRTLDLNGGNPSCNQGGIMIVEPVPYTLKIRSGCEGGGKGALIQKDKPATLSTLQDQTLFQPVYSVESDTANTLNAFDVGDVRTTECVVYQDSVVALCARDYKGVGSQYVDEDKLVVVVDQGGGKSACNVSEGQAPTLTCTHGGEPAVCYGINGDKDGNNVVRTRYIVRRLTPLECERLQGYPDGWTDIGEWTDSNGKKRQTSDAARYKALGNSIALPPWKWVLKRLCACYERDATMASLFDGIGGFPYLWEQLNGKGTCLWASEIEEFPIAVTKARIGGDT